MEAHFKAEVVINLEGEPGDKNVALKSTDFNLTCSSNIDKSTYLDSGGLPNKDGSVVLSNTLIQGLVGNIHMAHEQGFRDSAEHLRWIISELERGFVAVPTLKQGYMKDSKF